MSHSAPKDEHGGVLVAIECEPCTIGLSMANSPEHGLSMANGPEHGLATQLIETVRCIYLK